MNLIEMWNQMGFFAKAIAWILFIMSMISFGVAVERFYTFLQARKQSKLYAPQVAKHLKEGRLKDALALSQKKDFRYSHLAKVVRDSVVVRDKCKIGSLRHVKDDVREVRAGMECGIRLEGFEDVHVGDSIETYEILKIARRRGMFWSYVGITTAAVISTATTIPNMKRFITILLVNVHRSCLTDTRRQSN